MAIRSGMFVYALAFLLGVLGVQQSAELAPDFTLFFLLIVCAILVCAILLTIIFVTPQNNHELKRQFTLSLLIILLFLFGFIYASFYAKQAIFSQLNERLVGQDIILEGEISSIPTRSDKVQRFEFIVERYRLSGKDQAAIFDSGQGSGEFPKKVRLNWYYGRLVNAGEKWQFEVRLKPPHGFMNPGGFDYEAWLFQHGIHATGYVRKSALNERLEVSAGSVNYLRQTLAEQLDGLAAGLESTEDNAFSLVKALAIGDKSSITAQQWRVLTHTGTSHLMAISGLHIGLASLFAYVLVRRLVPAFVMKRMPAQHIALLAGMVSALLYALIAGLSIPTQRAVIMLFVLSLMLLVRRNHRPFDALGFALLMVLLVDPLAVLSAGFWFSFSAVAVIFISISRGFEKTAGDSGFWGNLFASVLAVLKQWVRLQLLISLFLLPLSLFMFQQVSLVSPLVNLLLIPYVSFLVVPVVLLAIILFFILPSASDSLFALAVALLDFVWPLISWFSQLPHALWIRGDVGLGTLLMVTLGMLLLYYAIAGLKIQLLPRPAIQNSGEHNKHRTLQLVMGLLFLSPFLALLISRDSAFADGEYRLTMLDVGQGSAAVIQTQNHALVFDAGAKFSDRLNAGASVVIPYLRTQGITQLQRLIISHGDNDHIGGAQAIIDEYPEVQLIGQHIEPLILPANKQGKPAADRLPCYSGMKWHWDGVDFIFLSPAQASISSEKKSERNNRSCVLKISSPFGSVLLTGDIEKKAEAELVQKHSKQLQSDILMVPHHGSNTSSTSRFVTAVNPKIALISVGYKNRYGLPTAKVLARYAADKRQIFSSYKTGAISIKLGEAADFKVEKYREINRKYWHHRAIN